MTASRWVAALWLPAVLLVSWQVLADQGVLNAVFFPPPATLAATAVEMLREGELQRHILATLRRATEGFAVGVLAGMVAGLGMGASPFVRRSLDPLISAVWASPKLSLLPMLILLLGIGDTPRIVLIALGCFIVVSLHLVDAVRGIHPAYVELARNYGAGRAALLRRVYLPAVTPAAFTAVRLAFGRALTLAISVELVSSPEGLGNLIFMAWQGLLTERLYVAVGVAAGLGVFFHATLRWLERRLITWRADEKAR
ncbi:MAG: ABC transporter permease [Bryobacterales bacterium]|nr:ABC transporter permease [Bryobacterales bacterium]